jgi:uncharacterized protein (TIGR02391 family)
MTKEEFISEIEAQKGRGRKLLMQVQQMHVSRNNFGDGMAVFGRPRMYYTPKEELDPVKAEYASWKLYVHDFLVAVLGESDDFVTEWNSCLQEAYRHDVSEREWYSKEIGEALSKLDSFIQRIGFRLGNNASKIDDNDALSIMHPRVVELVKDRFVSGHYSDALITSLKEINVIVKEKVRVATGKEQDGPSLMRTAFKLENPVIKLNSLTTQSEKDEQQGYCDLFAGAMEALRNPLSHSNIEITKEDAIHKLFFVSMLMHKICPIK